MQVKLGDWLSEGWNAVKDDILNFFLASLLAGVIAAATLSILGPPLWVGLYRMIWKGMSGRKVEVGEVFNGFDKFWDSLLVWLIEGAMLLVAGGMVAVVYFIILVIPPLGILLLPGVVLVSTVLVVLIHTLFFYAMPLVAADRAGAMEAISLSMATVSSQFWMYAAATFVYRLIMFAGQSALGIGVYLTMPIGMAAFAAAYSDVFGLPPQYAGASPAAPAARANALGLP